MAYTLYTNIKAKPVSYGGIRSASTIKYLVFHYTGNKTDTALANAKYFKNTNKCMFIIMWRPEMIISLVLTQIH